jgi:uncharacterized membrane protein YccF (DUF307 family)
MTDDYTQAPAPTPGSLPPTQVVTVAPDTGPGAGSVVLNILWVLFSGVWLFLGYVLAGILMFITIIGIPFGIQSFKLAAFALWPFGRVVVTRPDRPEALSCVGNVLWFVLAGFWLALEHAILGLLLCITIIGIPLGLGNFKLIPLAVAPFGRDIVPKDQLAAGA